MLADLVVHVLERRSPTGFKPAVLPAVPPAHGVATGVEPRDPQAPDQGRNRQPSPAKFGFGSIETLTPQAMETVRLGLNTALALNKLDTSLSGLLDRSGMEITIFVTNDVARAKREILGQSQMPAAEANRFTGEDAFSLIYGEPGPQGKRSAAIVLPVNALNDQVRLTGLLNHELQHVRYIQEGRSDNTPGLRAAQVPEEIEVSRRSIIGVTQIRDRYAEQATRGAERDGFVQRFTSFIEAERIRLLRLQAPQRR